MNEHNTDGNALVIYLLASLFSFVVALVVYWLGCGVLAAVAVHILGGNFIVFAILRKTI